MSNNTPAPLSQSADHSIASAGQAIGVISTLFFFFAQVVYALRLVAPATSNAIFPCVRVSPAAAPSVAGAMGFASFDPKDGQPAPVGMMNTAAPGTAVPPYPTPRHVLLFSIAMLLMDITVALLIYGCLGYWYANGFNGFSTAWAQAPLLGSSSWSSAFPAYYSMIISTIVAAVLDGIAFIVAVVMEVKALYFIWDLR